MNGKNIILCAIIPDITRDEFNEWCKTYLGKTPTDQEYETYLNRIKRFKNDIKAEGIPSLSLGEFKKI